MLADLKRLQRDTSSGRVHAAADSSHASMGPVFIDSSGSGIPPISSGPQTIATAASASASTLPAGAKSGKRVYTGIAVALLILAAASLAYLKFAPRRTQLNLQDMEITKLTQSGKASGVAISPDGLYVVYVLREGEKQSLMVRQVATGSDVQILSPDVITFYGLAFSPDSNYIYYTASSKENANFSFLYKIPVLGGSPVQLVRDIDTAPSFSPDGKRFAFLRGHPENGQVHLLLANLDGSAERVLRAKPGIPSPETMDRPAWSPDGKTILYSLYEPNNQQNLYAVSADDGSARLLYSTHEDIGQPA